MPLRQKPSDSQKSQKVVTTYAEHKKRWGNCKACDLCLQRQKVVLAKGKIPCDVLFIGEAPGVSEDVLGRPFVGPAGKLLDDMIEEAGIDQHRLAFTNVIACIPRGDEGTKTAEPPKLSVRACADRLSEMISIARPRAIVLVGKLAEKHVQIPKKVKSVSIIHPAAILRTEMQAGFLIQRVVVTLRDLSEELC